MPEEPRKRKLQDSLPEPASTPEPSSTPVEASGSASQTSTSKKSKFTHALHWPASASSPKRPGSSATRSEPTSQAVPAQADSQLEHPNNHFSTGRLKTVLAVLKGVLEITHEVAEVFIPLKVAVGGLLGILDWVEKVADVREEFESIAEKLSFMTKILEKYQSLPPNIQVDMTECAKKVADMIGAAVKVVEEKQKQNIIKRIALAPADAKEVERQLRAVSHAVDLFHMLVSVRQIGVLEDLRMLNQSSDAKLDNWIQSYLLDKLSPNVSARHDAMHIPCCTKDTRIQLLEEICTWAAGSEDQNVPPIFFLNGVAGSGKSTISKTLCASLHHAGRLGASFFCSRGNVKQRDVRSIFPTLAYLLSLYSPSFAAEVRKVLLENPIAASADIEGQFRVLIAMPAKVAFTTADAAPVIVIDAIDELEWPHDGPTPQRLLDIIVDHAPQLHFKFFITSRPEDGLRETFGPPNPKSDPRRKHVRLHDIARDVVDADILRYLTEELKAVPVPTSLLEDAISTLAKHSQGLFIYAATAGKYIQARNVPHPPTKRLEDLISSRANARATGIDVMYDYILEQALQGLQDDEVEIVLRCLHAVVCARNPLSVPELAHLLRVTPVEVRYALVALHSVINVPEPEEEHGFLTTYHTSFPDYLTTHKRSGSKRWAADIGATHDDLFLGCLKTMNSGLCFNVSGRSTSYASNHEEPRSQVLPSYLVYACRFWIDHLTMSSASEERATQDVSAFFGNQFLYWLEVLSVCDHARFASSLVKRLEVWLRDKRSEQKTESATVSRCLRLLLDANEFLNCFWTPILHSAPHIYISALAFTPSKSEISQAYLGLLDRRLKVDTAQQLTPLPPLKIHDLRTSESKRGQSLAFSADSRCILSATDDDVCRWDARTGESIGQPQQGPDVPDSRIALSPDGSRAVSFSGRTARVWNTGSAGRPMGQSLMLPEDSASVDLVVFSPDSKCVAACVRMPKDHNAVIQEWDAEKGGRIGTPLVLEATKGKGDFIRIAFAPNGKQVAAILWHTQAGSSAAGIDGLWDAETGTVIAKLGVHIASVIFSPDSAFVVSGSAIDGGLRVWDAKTGRAIGQPRLNGHTDFVRSLAFSPDGKFLASGSRDTTVRVWSFEHGILAGHRVLGHTGPVISVVFSPDGQILASTTFDGTIWIWDVAQATTMGDTNSIGKPPGHTGPVVSVAFSPDGRQLASASLDGTVRVWDAHTGNAVGEPLLGRGRRYDVDRWPKAIAFFVDGNEINLVSLSDPSADDDAHRGPATEVWEMNSETNNSGRRLHKWPGYWGKDGTGGALSPDGKRIALRSENMDTIDILDWATGDLIVTISDMPAPYEGNAGAVSIHFSLDGRFIAARCFDDTIRVWETDTGTRVKLPALAISDTQGLVALSPDGKLLAYDASSSFRIMNLQTGSEHSFTVPKHSATSLAFSPDGKYVAASFTDQTVRVWDAQTGRSVLPPLRGQTHNASSVAFSPDSRRIATGSEDPEDNSHNTVRIWDVTVGASHGPQIVTGSDSPLVDLWESHGAEFNMTEDGWIIGPQKELFLWVPPEYRAGLYWPRMVAVMGVHPVRLDFSRFAHGSTWTECWRSP
ncbi:WD40-repeat-containing domain protein [Rhodofomes roseus]|uniref:WD40-repeat-containing domain protein n=1 Tax=Rhodofomes roseus TaxID=34475 RepID=A0ABQ8JYL4_9APHY|nr:WD40-repeat-containing domain protein [Rhodofomes roseus]KAH9829364.1 WD40-repeat-containing domain protein [Rhodofomes roseus]